MVHFQRRGCQLTVRLVARNSTATCQAYSETFTINIGEPRLEAPNVFSPGEQAPELTTNGK